MDTLESIRNKQDGAKDLKSVVSAMKAMASSNIAQYEQAVISLRDYYHTVALGIIAFFSAEKILAIDEPENGSSPKQETVCAIVFGSDQGLVGQFNDIIASFTANALNGLPGRKIIWVIGQRVDLLLADMRLQITNHYSLPGSLNGITALVEQILSATEKEQELKSIGSFYIFHNKPGLHSGYAPQIERFLPLDQKWKDNLQKIPWPTTLNPVLAGGVQSTLKALIREYLFTSLFKACAESLASENESRMQAMQRAEKNIDDLLENLEAEYHRMRQSSIDEELFDIISGFEALKGFSKQ